MAKEHELEEKKWRREGGREKKEIHSSQPVLQEPEKQFCVPQLLQEVTQGGQRRASISQLKIMFFHFCVSRRSGTESISSPLWRRCTFQKWTCFYFLRDEVGVGSQCLQIMSVSGISFSEHLLILWRTFPLPSSLLRDNLISVPFLVSWISSIWTRQKTSSKILMDFSGSACLTFV